MECGKRNAEVGRKRRQKIIKVWRKGGSGRRNSEQSPNVDLGRKMESGTVSELRISEVIPNCAESGGQFNVTECGRRNSA